MIGVEPLAVPTDDHRLTGDGLRAALAADPAAAEDLIGVVATAGTTNAGIVDDLAGVADVAAERRLWFHVDGAYGGAGLLAPSVRHLYEGIERADSLHRRPPQVAVRPVRLCRPPLPRSPAGQGRPHPGRRLPRDPPPPRSVAGHAEVGPWNPSDYAIHLTRRARGLPLWFSLAVHGLDAYRDAVETVLDTARRSAELIERAPHLSLVREPGLSVVLFRRDGWGRADYEGWSNRLLTDQTGFVTPTTWEGEPVARFAFLHPDTSLDMVAEILATMA